MMMVRNALGVAVVLAVTLLLSPPGFAGEKTTFGEGVELDEATPIHQILADPDAWVGKTVRIEGGVLDVCPMKGCWIEVGDDEQSLRVKVDDGVIVFPADAKGRLVAAQGEVEAVDMERQEYVDWLAHLAEERGEEFDPESADVGDGPYRLIRIRGTGAEIESP